MHTLPFMVSLLAIATSSTPAVAPVEPAVAERLAFGDSDEKIQAIGDLLSRGDESIVSFLQALHDGAVQVTGDERIFVVEGEALTDIVTGQRVTSPPADREDVMINNRVRAELASAIAALRLTSSARETRLAAAKELEEGADAEKLPLITKALAVEKDAEIEGLLLLVQATILLKSEDVAARLAAVKALASSTNPNTETLLLNLLEKRGDAYVEPDAAVRGEAERSLREVERALETAERIGQVFSGASLGSILLLAALGLAITYGLMGVINMAHGELIMIGAYATYVVQGLFRRHAGELFDWYLVAAVPASFLVAAAVGVVLERSVIRFLYGRPLETLLATWGISLILIQSVRTIFGAQNVQVENPLWMSGGARVLGSVVLPYSRIVIIGFASVVLLGVWVLLTRTRLGLHVRAVTQNRAMASSVGVRTARVDAWAFALGSGIAGLSGCALSQIGNVGPELGQSYIVDSFMVVVLGGVGQLAGTAYAALGLGVLGKFLEAWSGAVLAKIAVLVFIIVVIQKRPQGLFALPGRAADR